MLHHTKEGRDPIEASIMEQLEKYFAFIIDATKESGFSTILYNCLARRALLNIVRSLKPNPP
jgi:hypothetical protein